MLVTRPFDTGRNTWSSNKLGALYPLTASPRMSNFESLSSQPDWQEQYSSLPLPGESGLAHSSFGQTASANALDSHSQSTAARPQLEHRHSIGPLRKESHVTAVIERPESAPVDSGAQTSSAHRIDSAGSTEPSVFSFGSNLLNEGPDTATQQGTSTSNQEDPTRGEAKDEDDDEEDDDEMLDAEDGGSTVPQTAAERRAERRKMKRFRLTHQQTRFLMSEFAKQAHPDAAHRERLSREIPGLSPRQVQVWFQNRRAKIKRLTADDRERMMKMRAVPDDFDNVQALHSPYGAVQGIGTPLQSPVDFAPGYSDHMMRPLMVDTMRRNDHNEHISPSSISPAFGHVGFGHGGAIGGGDVLSPLSMNSTDRYYSTHLTSPLSAGARSANPFDRQSSYQALSHPRQQVRPLQPLQLRETMSRTRSESLQSPLRTSMSWKGDTIDYGHYQSGQPSPQSSGRHQSVYQGEQIGTGSVNAHQFDGSAYSGTALQTSPTQLSYLQTHGSTNSVQQSPLSRLRASSTSSFTPGLDLRAAYQRGISQQSPQGVTTPRSSSFSYSSGFASAPLTAPSDFQLPRTPIDGPRDFNIPQLSAPIQPPRDFQSAYTAGRSQAEIDFSGQSQSQQGAGGNQSQSQTEQQQNKPASDNSYLSPVRYESGQKRKRSFTLPGQYGS